MPPYSFPIAAYSNKSNQQAIDNLTKTVNLAMAGKVNATGEAVLSGTTSTVVTDPRAAGSSFILPMALSAAAGVALDTVWISGQDKGTFTINHAVPTAAAPIRYVIIA